MACGVHQAQRPGCDGGIAGRVGGALRLIGRSLRRLSLLHSRVSRVLRRGGGLLVGLVSLLLGYFDGEQIGVEGDLGSVQLPWALPTPSALMVRPGSMAVTSMSGRRMRKATLLAFVFGVVGKS